MPKAEKYSNSLDYSYALGVYPSIEAITYAPFLCKKLLIAKNAEGNGVEFLIQKCRQSNVRIECATSLLQKISGKKNTYVGMVIEKKLNYISNNTNHIVLHNIMDAGNLGTIIRTMLGFGFNDLVIIKPATDVFEPQTIRASMGAIFQLRYNEYSSFNDYLETFGNRSIFPFMLKANSTLQEINLDDINRPYSLLFGNEAKGLPEDFINIGKAIKINHKNNIDSLNLGNAVAISLYKFTEKSMKKEKK